MTAAGANTSGLRARLQFAIRGGIHYFSFWLLPALVVVFTAAAFLILPSLYTATDSQALHLRSLPIEAGHPSPGSNLAALQTVPLQRSARFDHGMWLSIALPNQARLQPMAVDFPAQGVRNLSCWREDTLEMLGSAEGMTTQGALRRSRLGYALMLGQNENDAGSSFSDVICRAEFTTPTTFTADLWSIPDLRSASGRFHRGVALLEGGIVTLALFLSIVAIRHREWTFLLLAVWLVGNLRLGMYALGWDGQWLGVAVPAHLHELLRQFTLAAYYVVTLALFTRFLHRSDRTSVAMMALQSFGILQLVAAFLLPWGAYQALSALIWAVTLVMGSWMLATSLTKQGKQFNWRVVPLGFALLVMLAALAMTLMGQERLLDSMTAVIAILVSNVFVALAVSDVLREGQMLRRRAQTELVTSYAVAPLGLFTLDDKGRFVHMNPILRDMLSAPADENALLHWTDYFPPQDWASIARSTLAGRETEVLLPPMRDEKRLTRHFALRAALVGEQVEGSLQDITARTEAMNALRDMVDTDTLTNALNRHGIEKQLDEAIGLIKRDNTPCSLAYMDLDHFKRINGLFGHTSGDEILKQITQRLRAVLAEEQSLGRIGSDEFVILFPDMSASEARHLAERIITDLNGSAYQVGQRYFHVRSAIGVVQIDVSMDAAAAISAASRACRDARKQHQDVVVYEQDSSELQAHTEELRLFDQLEGGASPKGLYLEMQPIMSLANPNECLNFEILLRVRDSQGRLLPTGKIVSGAEESGTITIIDKWVFSATLEWLAKHEDRLRKTQFVTVNLSGVSLNDDKFIENLFQLLNRHPKLVRRLCVEITEGVALQNLDRTRQLIVRLQSMGIRIALDDFGAGYTSFSYLRQLGADSVKIDGAFVRDMLISDTNVAIVRTIVELAQNLRMTSIAEWVEDPRALDLLREMGVDYVQGHAISAALTPMEILDAESLSDLVANADTLAYIKRNATPANPPNL